jgi:NAD(P)-dependent dehydrogenase (short-subunit alcohol dehydrogenase family)
MVLLVTGASRGIRAATARLAASRGYTMKRGGDPQEVARAILWLLSDEASYSTGTFVDVTGGK